MFLDCGNLERNPAEAFRRAGGAEFHIVNIDHHHDNTLFGTVNYVLPEASCTAEIVWDLMHGLGVKPTLNIAEALYVGLITDTGRFMYENTGPRAHEMAADLIEAGVDVHEIYRRVYEGVPYGKLALLARGLAKVHRFDDGRLTVTELDAHDFAESGAEESYSEGVIDHLRVGRGDRGGGARSASGPGTPTAAAPARCRCAPATSASTCRRSRASRAGAATVRRRASRRRWSGTSWSRSCVRKSRSSCPSDRRARPTASSCSTSRPASPRMTRSRGCGARSAGARSVTPARSIRSRPGCC